MKKIEQVYREILYQCIEKDRKRFTQLRLSENLEISISTVNLAVKKLRSMNAVRVNKMGFSIVDEKKILYLWASVRNLKKDLLYKTRVEKPVRDLEKEMPEVVYAGYSAYKFKFEDVPADYSEVYVYADQDRIKELKERFPENKNNPNLFVLKADENMGRYGNTGTLAQIFVDLWNMKEWYADDFIKALQNKLDLEK